MRKAIIFFLLIFLIIKSPAFAGSRPCLDPISTVDWGFFFDEFEISDDADLGPFCICKSNEGIKVGLKFHIAEPIGFIEVVNKAYDFPCFGFNLKNTVKMSGTSMDITGTKRNIHYIKYPVFAMLNIILDYLCIEKNRDFDLLPPSELDPRQNNPVLAMLFQPDKLIFANPAALALSITDCVSSSAGHPMNALYGYAGCWGALGEVTPVSDGTDPVSESALLAAKEIDLLHSDFQLWKYSDAQGLETVAKLSGGKVLDSVCEPTPFPRIIKSQYRLNLSYPAPTDAVVIGETPLKGWPFFKQYPGKETFVWTVWRIRDCCAGFQLP